MSCSTARIRASLFGRMAAEAQGKAASLSLTCFSLFFKLVITRPSESSEVLMFFRSLSCLASSVPADFALQHRKQRRQSLAEWQQTDWCFI